MNKIDDLLLLKEYEKIEEPIELFMDAVVNFFKKNKNLNCSPLPIVHSIKYRMKDRSHIIEKIHRKINKGKDINLDNLWSEITDIAGVRVLHLHQDQFATIHEEIISQVNCNEWAFVEKPKAYTWDPEYQQRYLDLNITPEIKDSYYTSVHYLVRPNNDKKNICCEIQVRTLFEEIWGEIDHTINYPEATSCIACKEQLRVLSKLVSTGTRLADSIFASHKEFLEIKE